MASGTIKNLISLITKHRFGTEIGLNPYSSASNKYTCPSDGYVKITCYAADIVAVYIDDQETDLYGAQPSGNLVQMTFVKKDMSIYIYRSSTRSDIAFVPLI